MIWLLQKLKRMRSALLGKDSPRQMAAGLACGLVLGLLPKGNLLAILVATILLSTRMSLAIGMLTAFCVSLVAPWSDVLTNPLGHWVLTSPPLIPFWQWLAQLPLVGWTSFNNTVVMGSFLLGTLLMYPTYRLTLPWMIRLQQRLAQDRPSSIQFEAATPCEPQVSRRLDASSQERGATWARPIVVRRRTESAQPLSRAPRRSCA